MESVNQKLVQMANSFNLQIGNVLTVMNLVKHAQKMAVSVRPVKMGLY